MLSKGKVVLKGSVQKSFSASEGVAEKYEDENKIIDDVEVIEESREEKCKSAKKARYKPDNFNIFVS